MAESIWNNNYLLSNLDAQKLYAQSPLTTGVSGSSAYIGIEPSARYNETVLWTGIASGYGSKIIVSEPISGFEKIDIYWKDYNRYFITTLPGIVNELQFGEVYTDGGQPQATCFSFSKSSTGTYTMEKLYHQPLKATADVPFSASTAMYPYKVIGINRKEV